MNYIDPTEYSKLVKSFTMSAEKGLIKESVEEGNAFTAGLAKTKKRGRFTVGGTTFADVSDYDAEGVEESIHQDKATMCESGRDLSKLSTDERKQLKEYIESVRTINVEIKRLVEKATIQEGGDTTDLVMSVDEDEDDDDEFADMEKKDKEEKEVEQLKMGQYDPH